MFRLPVLVLSAILAAGCASAPRHADTTGDEALQVVVMRHAEKAADAGDPPLSDAGTRRAAARAERLRGADVVAVYATDTRRARDTAHPIAEVHGRGVTLYDPRQPPAEFAAAVRAAHARGTVVVVGHSNTAPALAAAFCGCEVAPMADDEYDRVLRVRDAAGAAALAVERD